jgi:tetratricopeptide (TPR) repeat protein
VSIDPNYSEAWGALALAYTHGLDGFGEAELASVPNRIRSAAARALELDQGNADAQLALICIPPFFLNWARTEAQLRRLCDQFPKHWLAHGRLAMLLYQTGRWRDGIVFHERAIAIDPMIAGPYAFCANALSNAGRVQEADTMLRRGLERWPAHRLLWHTKFHHLLYSGRPQSAAAFLMDPEALPSGFGQPQVASRLRLVRAVERGEAADVQAVIDHFIRLAESDSGGIVGAAPVFSFFNRHELTFATLERYLLNRGSFGTPANVGAYTRRDTSALFTIPMRSARADPRFANLVREIGLQAYWQRTRVLPDYQRTS